MVQQVAGGGNLGKWSPTSAFKRRSSIFAWQTKKFQDCNNL